MAKKVDKSGLPGPFKGIYQDAILTRIFWPLMLYEISMTTVIAMERKINGYLCRWLSQYCFIWVD